MAELTDYTTKIYTHHYVSDGCKLAFTIYPDFYSEDEGLDETGNYTVIAIGRYGTTTFKIKQKHGSWVADGQMFDDILLMEKINEAMIGRKVAQA